MSFLTPIETPPIEKKRVRCHSVFDTTGRDFLPLLLETFSNRQIICDSIITGIETYVAGSIERTYIDETFQRHQVATLPDTPLLFDFLPNAASLDVANGVKLEASSISRPSFLSKSGDRRTSPDLIEAWRLTLMREVDLVVVNHREASAILDRTVETVAHLKDASKAILDFGAKSVLVTGGHLDGIVRDFCADGSDLYEFGADQVRKNASGAGAFHAGVILACIARDRDFLSAIDVGRRLVTIAIDRANGAVVDTSVIE